MTEPTTDEKIQMLVRSVLEAVDARLETVRHEMTTLTATLASVEQRIAALSVDNGEPATSGLDAALVDRVAALERRLGDLQTAAPSGTSPAPNDAAHDTSDLSELARPLMVHGHITTQVPIVPDHMAIAEPMPAPAPAMPSPTLQPMSFAPAPAAPPAPEPASAIDDQIDIERLTSLLSERLGHLSLPTGTE
jgi:hypothetical protein